MELAAPPPPASLPIPYRNNISHSKGHNSGLNSMSQDYHQQGIFSFSNGFEIRSQQQQHIAQQIRRDKLRLQGFEQPPPPLVAIEEVESGGVYETAGMLSEMFNFPPGTGPELLENQMSAVDYRNPRPPSSQVSSNDWYGNNRGMVGSGGGGGNINVESSAAAAMQLFLMQPRSPSPAPSQPPPSSSSSTLHMLLPNPPPPSNSSNLGFHHTTTTTVGGSATSPPGGGVPSFVGPPPQFTWINPPTVHEGQGLSLSLSSSLQHLEAAKAEELRMGDDSGMLFFNNHGGSGGVGGGAQYQYKNLGVGHHHLQVHAGIGMVNVLRNSKYVKAAQELLEEFCSVGRGQYFKKHKFGSKPNNSNNPSNGSSFSSKDLPPLSASDRIEHQRRKVKLLAMLDEVDRRYNHYCEQMQMVVNSFDLVMGFGAAIPYTALAQKAMSRHFRCLKDAIATQLKNSCEVLGEKDVGTSGVTKGETPRLKLLEQSLRQQRAFNQMGMMEQEAWRPQRGLPERSVNTLRAWLFEHFLHPYPSDADKHLLARQTGLSRNQVSNWFINARVRLWKPMVEEMYQQESKEDAEERERDQQDSDPAQTPMPTTNITTPTLNPPSPPPSSSLPPPSINALDNDTSLVGVNTHYFSENQAKPSFTTLPPPSKTYADYRTITTAVATTTSENAGIGSTPIRFGTAAGDVSLTLGLRHTGNPPEKAPFSVRDFGDC